MDKFISFCLGFGVLMMASLGTGVCYQHVGPEFGPFNIIAILCYVLSMLLVDIYANHKNKKQ